MWSSIIWYPRLYDEIICTFSGFVLDYMMFLSRRGSKLQSRYTYLPISYRIERKNYSLLIDCMRLLAAHTHCQQAASALWGNLCGNECGRTQRARGGSEWYYVDVKTKVKVIQAVEKGEKQLKVAQDYGINVRYAALLCTLFAVQPAPKRATASLRHAATAWLLRVRSDIHVISAWSTLYCIMPQHFL